MHHPNLRLAARYKFGVGWFWLLTLEVQVAVEIGPGRVKEHCLRSDVVRKIGAHGTWHV